PVDHLVAMAIAAHIGADDGSGHRTTSRGEITAGTAAHLVAQNASDDTPDDRTRHIGTRLLWYRFALDPAALLGLAYHGPYRQRLGLVQPFVAPPAVVLLNLAGWGVHV